MQERNTHDDSGFVTQQTREYNDEEEELILSGDDENKKGSPLLTKQTKGTTRNSKKQRKHPQPHQMSDITNILDVQVTNVTQPRTNK